MDEALDRLEELARRGIDGEIRSALAELLPEARLGEPLDAPASPELGEQEFLH